MKSGEKSPFDDRQNGRSGPRPGRLVVEAIDTEVGKKPYRSRARQEGWDERVMVGLAVALAVIIAAVTIYQTIAWAQI